MSKRSTSLLHRQRKIKEIESSLPNFQKVMEEFNLPLMQYWSAVKRYKVGIDEDSIIHSALAVELALALKLNTSLTEDDKKTRRGKGIEFGQIISLAKTKGILDENNVKIAREICNLRNMFVHIGNWVQFLKDLQLMDIIEDPYFKQLMEKYPEIRDILELRIKESQSKTYAYKSIENLNDALKNEVSKLDRIPDLSWVSRKSTLDSQKDIMSSYFRDVIKNAMSEKGLNKIIKKMKISKEGAIKFMKDEYNYLEPAALETLQKTHKILTYLSFLN